MYETDTDWAADKVERKSTTSVAAMVQDATETVKTTCRAQSVQALSSLEADTYGIDSGVVEGRAPFPWCPWRSDGGRGCGGR